jgi:hypothetical protein
MIVPHAQGFPRLLRLFVIDRILRVLRIRRPFDVGVSSGDGYAKYFGGTISLFVRVQFLAATAVLLEGEAAGTPNARPQFAIRR